MLLQRERDMRAGLNTAGFVSGYRGSPLGGLDQALWRAQKHLESHHVKFQPGVNEDLAAAAIWGTQQVTMFPKARYDGVFGMWYGKGPGSTVAATSSSTRTPPAHPSMAACWCSRATTTPLSPRPCRTSPSISSRPASSRI